MFITPITPLGELSGQRIQQAEQARTPNELPFKEIFTTAIHNMQETERVAANNTALLALGEIDDLHTLGIDATKAFLAERLVIELRNRTMEAYSEIMRMNF